MKAKEIRMYHFVLGRFNQMVYRVTHMKKVSTQVIV